MNRRPSKNKAALAAVAAALTVAACCTTRGAGLPDPPTIALEQLMPQIERYRGRTVRTCGQLDGPRPDRTWIITSLKQPEEYNTHGRARTLVMPCANTPPRLDLEGCISGRVAQKDGSLNYPPGPITIEDGSNSLYWHLHPQCPAQRQ